ncbi:MAG: gliding motility-associated C-terminal domain-containing protein [Microscillaceae bacterium]|nr:gliding motility-associated C-terminal domain-containing protein [Microscillaceae bacterium]
MKIFTSLLCIVVFFTRWTHIQAADFIVSAGNVYDTDGLVAAILAANANTDAVNTIQLAEGSLYILDRIHSNAEDLDGNYGPVGLPSFARNKKLIIQGNGATIRRESTDKFRLMFAFMHSQLVINNLTFESGNIEDIGGAALMINFNARLELTACKFQNNSTDQGSGGALFLRIRSKSIIRNCQFTNNLAHDDGGAIYSVLADLQVESCKFVNNKVINLEPPSTVGETGGGAIFVDGADENENKGNVSITLSEFDGNESSNDQGRFAFGGAIFLFAYNNNTFVVDQCIIKNSFTNTFGGGLCFSGSGLSGGDSFNASFKFTNSTIDNNTTNGQGAGIWIGDGGNKKKSPKITLSNLTIHNNVTQEFGGGLVSYFQGLNLNNCTIANNQAQKNGGGIFGDASININNCILYNNTSPEAPNTNHCSRAHQGSGNIQFPNSNILCVSGITILDPLLGPLQNNGGSTPTMALLEGSPAIDAGNNTCINTDQRGLFRSGKCDIGAFELNGLETDPNPEPEPDTTNTELVNAFNILTPNGDGRNDTWLIEKLNEIGSYQIRVMTKNGQTVLQTNNYNQDWDGTYQGKALPAGIYYYSIQINGEKKPITGYITLIR